MEPPKSLKPRRKRKPTPLARERKRLKRELRKARKAERLLRRKAKREAKSGPKRRLAAWSLVIRSEGKCVVCGATEHLNAHPLLPKERYPQLKLKVINGVCLCPTHHKFGRYSAHRNPIWFADW